MKTRNALKNIAIVALLIVVGALTALGYDLGKKGPAPSASTATLEPVETVGQVNHLSRVQATWFDVPPCTPIAVPWYFVLRGQDFDLGEPEPNVYAGIPSFVIGTEHGDGALLQANIWWRGIDSKVITTTAEIQAYAHHGNDPDVLVYSEQLMQATGTGTQSFTYTMQLRDYVAYYRLVITQCGDTQPRQARLRMGLLVNP